MALDLLWADGFDGYQTAQLEEFYTAVIPASGVVEILPAIGTCGSAALHVQQKPGVGGVIAGLAGTGAVVTVEFRFKMATTGGQNPSLFTIQGAGLDLIQVVRGPAGEIAGVYAPGAAFPPTSFATGGGLVPGGVWTKVGVKILLGGPGAGKAAVQINGVTVFDIDGIQTSNDGIVWSGIGISGRGTQATTNTYYDDLTVCSGSTWNLNEFLGNTQVQTLLATAPGANTDWTVTGVGANWQVSSTNTPDPSTIYVESSTLGAIDTYTYADLPLIANTEIFGVMASLFAWETAAGSRQIQPAVRQGGTDYLIGSPQGVPTTDPRYLHFVAQTNPATSAAWLLNDVNSDEFGVEITT